MPKRPIVLAAFSLALMAAGPSASAQSGGGNLAAGTQSLAQGDYAGAVKQLSAALADTRLSKADAAKALYQRGVAQRLLGKQSGAIADLSQAIWLGDLSSGEKMRAHVHRGMAYRASGLAAQAEADMAEARKIDAGGADRMLAANQGAPAPAAAAAPVRGPQPPAQPARPAAPQAAEAPVQLQPKRAEAPRQPEAPRKAEAPKQIQPRAAQLPPGENVPAAWQTEDAIAAEREQEGGRVSRFFGGITDRVRGWTGRDKQEEQPVQQPLSNDEWAATVTPAEKPKRIAQKPEQVQQEARQPAAQPQQSAQREGQAPAPVQVQPAQAPQPVGRPQQLQPPRQQVARAVAPDVPQPVQSQAPRAAQPLQQAAAGGGGGGYLLQLASARSEQEAQAAWQTISSRNAQLVGGRPPIVKQANLGSLGTFYRVHIGPFQDKAQSVNLCNEFKRQGVDCFLVTR